MTTMAVLYSSFPNDFTDKKILPSLRRYGIGVISVNDSGRPSERGLSQADIVLVLHERMGHGADRQIRAMAQRFDLPVVYLSRKTAGWSDRLRAAGVVVTEEAEEVNEPASEPAQQVPEEPMDVIPIRPVAAEKLAAVADAQADTSAEREHASLWSILKPMGKTGIEAFMRGVVSLSDSGVTYAKMAEHPDMIKFFGADAYLTEGRIKDLVGYVAKHADKGQNEWFANWHRGHRGRRRALRPGERSVLDKQVDDETEALANEYARENDQLKERIKLLEAELSAARAAPRVVESQSSVAPNLERELREALSALDTLVGLGLMDAASALKTIRTKLNLT